MVKPCFLLLEASMTRATIFDPDTYVSVPDTSVPFPAPGLPTPPVPQTDPETQPYAPEPRPYRERVARGIKWLDAERPDWRERIPLSQLRVSDPCKCILGWVYGGGERDKDTCASGFGLCMSMDGWSIQSAIDRGFEGADLVALTTEWKRQILEGEMGGR